MNLNKQQSEKYLEIVRNGNMDDMFDFGRECERQAVITEVEGWLVDEDEVKLVEKDDKENIRRYYVITAEQKRRNAIYAELRAKLVGMKEGKQ